MVDGPLRYIGPRLVDVFEVDPAASPNRADIQAFCRAHGEDPHEVAWSEWRSGPEVAFCVYLNDENGRRYMTADGVPATEIHTHPLIVDEWPKWWIPFETGSWFYDSAARLEGAH